ncbi:hypothetical protein Tco_0739765 [Tanacetum coccineum]
MSDCFPPTFPTRLNDSRKHSTLCFRQAGSIASEDECSSRPFGKQQRRLRLGSSIAHTLSEEVETPADLGKKRRKQTKSNGLRVKKMRISDGSSFRQNIGTVQEADLIKMERRGKRRVKAMTFLETDIREKDEKQSQNNKTEHENEKSVKKSKSQSQKER